MRFSVAGIVFLLSLAHAQKLFAPSATLMDQNQSDASPEIQQEIIKQPQPPPQPIPNHQSTPKQQHPQPSPHPAAQTQSAPTHTTAAKAAPTQSNLNQKAKLNPQNKQKDSTASAQNSSKGLSTPFIVLIAVAAVLTLPLVYFVARAFVAFKSNGRRRNDLEAFNRRVERDQQPSDRHNNRSNFRHPQAPVPVKLVTPRFNQLHSPVSVGSEFSPMTPMSATNPHAALLPLPQQERFRANANSHRSLDEPRNQNAPARSRRFGQPQESQESEDSLVGLYSEYT